MTEWGVFGVIGTLLAFIGSAYAMFYKPTHELRLELVALNVTLKSLTANVESQNIRLNSHSTRIDKNERDLIRTMLDNENIKKEIDALKAIVNNLKSTTS